MINIWYIDKTAQKNADDYLSFYPTAINLSILDFKEYIVNSVSPNVGAINLSILDFKGKSLQKRKKWTFTINLSILDFKAEMPEFEGVPNDYKSIHIGF